MQVNLGFRRVFVLTLSWVGIFCMSWQHKLLPTGRNAIRKEQHRCPYLRSTFHRIAGASWWFLASCPFGNASAYAHIVDPCFIYSHPYEYTRFQPSPIPHSSRVRALPWRRRQCFIITTIGLLYCTICRQLSAAHCVVIATKFVRWRKNEPDELSFLLFLQLHHPLAFSTNTTDDLRCNLNDFFPDENVTWRLRHSGDCRPKNVITFTPYFLQLIPPSPPPRDICTFGIYETCARRHVVSIGSEKRGKREREAWLDLRLRYYKSSSRLSSPLLCPIRQHSHP